MSLVADLRGAVAHGRSRCHPPRLEVNSYEAQAAALEALDFEEQFSLAEDDDARVALCRRWLVIYRPEQGLERRTAIHA